MLMKWLNEEASAMGVDFAQVLFRSSFSKVRIRIKKKRL